MAEIEGQSREGAPPKIGSSGLPTNDRTYIRWGLVVLLIAFGVFGGWAAFAPLESAAVAPGQIAVESSRKTVQHLEGGIVSDIRVENGDQVEKGDILMRLDTTKARSELETVQSRLWTALARKARLEAERTGEETIAFPQALTSRSEDPEVAELMATQREELRARRESLESELAARRQRIHQLEEQIAGIKEQMAAEKALMASYEEEVGEWQSLFERQMADKKKLREAERRLAEVKGKLGSHRSRIAELRAQIKEARQKIVGKKREFHQKVVAKLQEAQSQILDARARLGALRDTLKRTKIRAPASGEVVELQVHTEGAVIQAGKPVMHIVPQTDDFIIKARVKPNDIDRVHKGLKADVRFPAFSSVRDTIPAEVLNVSADAITDEQTDARYYEARVRVTPEGVDKMRRLDITLQPGMPAEALINTGERTLLEYLLNPITSWMSHAMREGG